MRLLVGCIDIGSNTTRLLVATVERGRLRPVENRRAFTRIGAAAGPDGRIPAQKIAEVAAVARALCEAAQVHGVSAMSVVATAAVRRAPNAEELVEAVRASCGHELRVLDGAEEASYSFAGACHALARSGGTLAVLDVGGGSTEIAVGEAGASVEWSESAPVGSSTLCAEHFENDPPSLEELEAAEAAASSAITRLSPPVRVREAVAVGGTATALVALTGGTLTPEALAPVRERLRSAPADQLAGPLGLPVERVRLLPAGLTILAAAGRMLDVPLGVVGGGLREGVALELAGAA